MRGLNRQVAALKEMLIKRGILRELRGGEADLAKPASREGKTYAYELATADCMNVIYKETLGS